MRAAAIILSLACTEAWARPRHHDRKLVLRRGGEESLAAGVARAAALVDAKQLDEAEALLLELRARDARRADLPPELRRGFAHLFEARADEDKDDALGCSSGSAQPPMPSSEPRHAVSNFPRMEKEAWMCVSRPTFVRCASGVRH